MGHDWILDVLADLRSYAAQNGLHALSLQAEETLRIARRELAEQRGAGPLADGPRPRALTDPPRPG
ncbi:MAG: hypothetical protein KGI94_05990 [Paracoccaceae bacterium]|nr:hypothetical protein [Paracoccaceae bacterium]MDE3122009.1 hypothetical protein [Paracoccaceae bacterium]MDE3238830.1 hypothetical protein [Paracoccaceae bacterium]